MKRKLSIVPALVAVLAQRGNYCQHTEFRCDLRHGLSGSADGMPRLNLEY